MCRNEWFSSSYFYLIVQNVVTLQNTFTAVQTPRNQYEDEEIVLFIYKFYSNISFNNQRLLITLLLISLYLCILRIVSSSIPPDMNISRKEKKYSLLRKHLNEEWVVLPLSSILPRLKSFHSAWTHKCACKRLELHLQRHIIFARYLSGLYFVGR